MSEKDVENMEPDERDTEAVESGEPDEQAAQTPEQLLAQLQGEYDELEAKYLRVSADYQNYVRRAHQNATAATEQKLMEMAKALLTVIDHFDHALNVDGEKTDASSVLKGVQIVHEELLKTLEQFGIKRLDVQVGDEFDPNRHEAMMRQAVDDMAPNRVAAQLQPGYLLGDKILRPAKVTVTE